MHPRALTGRRYQRWGGVAATAAGCLLPVVACLLPAAVDAQEAEPSSIRVPLHGIVYDAFTGAAVAGAAVYLNAEGYGVLSDSAGVFRFADVFPGPQLVAAIQFGYEETAAPVEVPEEGAFIEIELTPQPILLDGVTAVVDNISTMERRMRSRRRSTRNACCAARRPPCSNSCVRKPTTLPSPAPRAPAFSAPGVQPAASAGTESPG